jgi:hypothetical protein
MKFHIFPKLGILGISGCTPAHLGTVGQLWHFCPWYSAPKELSAQIFPVPRNRFLRFAAFLYIIFLLFWQSLFGQKKPLFAFPPLFSPFSGVRFSAYPPSYRVHPQMAPLKRRIGGERLTSAVPRSGVALTVRQCVPIRQPRYPIPPQKSLVMGVCNGGCASVTSVCGDSPASRSK